MRSHTQTAADARARRAAKREGLVAKKTPWGFALIHPDTNCLTAGFRLDMSAEEVVTYCAGPEYRREYYLREKYLREEGLTLPTLR